MTEIAKKKKKNGDNTHSIIKKYCDQRIEKQIETKNKIKSIYIQRFFSSCRRL